MAERTNGDHYLLESSIGSNEGSKVTVSVEASPKSPSKTKRTKKVSLFKKSTHDEGSSSKIGGRGKRKGSKEKRTEGVEAHEVVEPQQQAPEIVTTSPVHHNNQSDEAEVHHYDIHTQDPEQKSTGDLSVKQFQKLNRELAKQKKSVDALKKEKELLVSEKVKLKSENKSLEKVLKKTNSKGDIHRMSKKQSQLSMDEGLLNLEDFKIKVKELEDQLAERDYKITVLRLRLEKHSDHLKGSDGIEITEGEKFPTGIRTTNGGILDSTATLEILLEEQDTSLKLRKENADLRSCILAMDAELDRMHRDCDPSPKSPRKRSSGFFKRGKKSTSSMPSRRVSDEYPQDIRGQKRSQSPVIGKSESHHELDVSISPLLSRANKESTTSLPCYGSPNQSPHLPTKKKANSDLVTLQACLKLALNEKSFCEENLVHLQKELDGARVKIQELESALAARTNEGIEKIRKSLAAAEIDRDTYHDELEITQQEVDEMMEKQRKLDKSYADGLKAKNIKIKELEDEIEYLRNSRHSSLSGSSSNISSPKRSTPATSPKEKVFSPTRHFKDATSPTQPSAKSTVEHHTPKTVTTETTTPSSDTLKQGRVRRLSKDLSTEKLPCLPTSSSTRKVGKLSRESSIDRFETPKENTNNTKRKNSASGIPPPSPSHTFAKVAATRAMFEQKIDQTKSNQTQVRRSSKMMGTEEQKRRFSVGGTSTSNTEDKARTLVMHSKSNSYDLSAKPSLLKSPGTSIERVPEVMSVPVDNKSKSVPPTSVKDASNGPGAVDNEARNKINNAHKQQQEKKSTSSTVSVLGTSSPTSKAPENLSSATTKVSKITITSTVSPTSSPILMSRRDMSLKLPHQGSSPTVLLVRNPTSPSLGNRRTPSPTLSNTRVLCSQKSAPGKANAPVRRQSPSKVPSLEEHPSTTLGHTVHHPAVTKSQTQVKIHSPVSSWSKNGKQSSHTVNNSTTTTTTTSTSTTVAGTSVTNAATTTSSSPTSRSIPKATLSVQDSKLTSPISKVGSLQNIQSYVNSSDDSIPAQNTVKVSSSSTTFSSGIRRGPTHRALQRRERKERPKTMYAGRAETTNLVNLISKFQEEEKDKKLKDIRTSTAASQLVLTSLVNRPTMNGTSSSSSNSLVSSPVSPAVSSSMSNVSLRQNAPGSNRQRPLTFYIGDSSASSTTNMSEHSLASSHSHSSSSSSSKPPPHERKLCRAQTVGVGLGNNRISKKGMLLKWCQMITQSYENVKISNFAESFSSGLAFCAMMHHFIPDQVPFSTLTPVNRERNFKIAFQAAEGVGIPSLLDVEDMVSLPIPDWMSVMTYVSFIYNKFGQENQQSQQQQKQSSMV